MTTGPGSEDPHHAVTGQERLSVPDLVAEEVVEELNLHRVPDEDDERLPSMSEQIAEQLGGMRGLIESSIPVLAFVLLNVVLGSSLLNLPKHTALYWAIGGAVGTAVLIGGYRLFRREPVRHAVNGIVGIAFGAYLAWRTGEARNFYLPGILLTFGQAAILLISALVRRPIIGYVWAVMANKGKHDWLQNSALFRTFQWLTYLWTASLVIRAGLQFWLYLENQDNLIGIVRIAISWPMYVGMFALTVWAVRRVARTEEVAS